LPERLFSARIVAEKRILEAEMKALIFASIIITLSAVTSAEAKGCLKGAAVGGVAGHYSGHHGLLGAAAGCVIGRHEANKRDRLQKNQIDQSNRDLRNGEERL
jgi:outer membrane lipoprotein SlyB